MMLSADLVHALLRDGAQGYSPSTINICKSLTSSTVFSGGVAADSTVGTELDEGWAVLGVIVPFVDNNGLEEVASTYAAKGDFGVAAEILIKKRKVDP